MTGKEKTTGEEQSLYTVNKPVNREITTLIGEGCRIEGNFFVPTTTRIDGIIKGDIKGDAGIIIGNKALINGNINASEVSVYGTVTGNIEADRIEMKRGSNTNGDISVNNLITETGAVFNGKCSMKSFEANVTDLNM